MFQSKVNPRKCRAPSFPIGTLLLVFAAWSAVERTAWAQKQLADELIVIAAGQRAQDTQRDAEHGGPGPGGKYNRLGPLSASGSSALLVSPGDDNRNYSQRRDVLSAAANPIPGVSPSELEVLTAPPRISSAQVPGGGTLERPETDEEGPPEGLALDVAVGLIADQSLSLRAKFQEIPKATADVLTAGLRGNPLLFGSVDEIPYRPYTPTRPGEVGYSLTVIQPVDINHKRHYRVIAAQRARDVLQAQYQDAVRLEIENLQLRYVDVLAARETVRYVDASLVGLSDVRKTIEGLVKGQQVSTLEVDRISVQIDAAELAREEALANYYRAKQNLAAMLDLPAPDVVPLEVRGSIRTDISGLPDAEQLLELACANRPDLRAYQFGVNRAAADVDLAVKERYPDIFVLYTPWGLRDNSQVGGQNANSWSISAMASVPLFNRNQGNIRRAEVNVGQTRLEWQHLARQVESEVRQSARECQVAAEKVRRLDESILPRAKNIRDKTLVQLQGGQVDSLVYLQSQREYVEIVRQYRDALIELRRAALHVNTVVGMRLVY
jgi:cobalt-zinc-cadmium efflux system outer membrane protein